MPKYLFLRTDGRSQNWQVRLVVPSDIQALHPALQREIKRSTGTPDRKKAMVVAARVLAEFREKWQELRENARAPVLDIALRHVTLSTSLIEQIAGARLASWAFTDNAERYEEGLEESELVQIEQFCSMTDASMRSVLAQGRHSLSWESVVQVILEWSEDLGYSLEVTDPLFPQLVRKFAQAERAASTIIKQRNAGEFVDFPSVDERPLLSSMVSHYTNHDQGKVNRKVLTTNISIWNRFVKFNGDVALASVLPGNIYRFLESRLQSADDPWSEEYTLGRAKITLKKIFGLARTLSLTSEPNPVLGMEINPRLNAKEAESRKKPRFPYTTNHLNAIFSSEWYNPSSKRFTGKLKEDLAMRYWGPLISLFHGMRVREVVQLHSHDFRIESDVLLMTFQLDLKDTASSASADRSLKNEPAKRTVPVHPILLELGFASFLKDVATRHPVGSPLFQSAIPDTNDKDPKWGRSYEQAFLRQVRDHLGLGHGYGNHSFRHTVEDVIRDVQLTSGLWPPGLSQFYTGRKLPRDADKLVLRLQGSEVDYGLGYNPTKIVSYIEKIRYPEVVLPPAFAQWIGEG
ncbi:DUF6538 domain-containing protein [Massilia sp. TN1-12]|uniref:DUF6538 domain-containing protein n=1 Tax=Massilia paldalensis TaxID=3377675 RepID=UPI00384F9085